MKKKILSLLFSCILCISAAIGIGLISVSGETEKSVAPSALFTADSGVVLTDNEAIPDYVVADQRTGLGISTDVSRLNIHFKNVIDVEALDADVPLLEWIPNPETRGNAEIAKFTVTLTDADDEESFVKITYSYTGHYSTIVRAFNNKIRESEMQFTSKRIWGQNLANYRETANWEQSTIPLYALSYNSGSNELSLKACSPEEEYDLDDESYFGIGKTFDGFRHNRVKLTVSMESLVGGEAHCVLVSVAGVPLGGTEINAETTPSVLVETPDVIPTGEKGVAYDLFDATAYDLIDGDADYTISIAKPGSTEFAVAEEKSFTPDSAGLYTLRYSAKNSRGKTNYKDIGVDVKNALEYLDIKIDDIEKTEYNLGENIVIPNYEVCGGSGVYSSYVKVNSLDSGKELEISNGVVVASCVGRVKIEYSATDYLKEETRKAVVVEVSGSGLPVLNADINVPQKFFDGIPAVLPVVSAYDYESYAGVAAVADCKITATGTGDKASKEEIVYDSREDDAAVFLPQISDYGESVVLKYAFKCLNEPEFTDGKYIEKTFTVEIAPEPEYIYDYFDYSAEDFSMSYNAPGEEGHLEITQNAAQTDETFGYVGTLAAEGASVSLNFPYAGQKFSAFRIRFSDANDKNIGFEIDLKKTGGAYSDTTTVVYNGRDYVMQGGFELENPDDYGSLSKTLQEISFSNNALYDYGDNKICDIDTNINGLPFEGFSGGVRIEFMFIDGQSGAAVQFLRIGNQPLAIEYETNSAGDAIQDENGAYIIKKFQDIVRPTISYEYELNQTYTIGQRVYIPKPYAYDEATNATLLNGAIVPFRVTISVRKPSGGYIDGLKNVDYSEGLSFDISEFGNYTILYEVRDYAGNKGENRINIVVEDEESPIVTIKNSNDIRAKVNEDITLSSFTAQDNATPSEEMVTHVFIINPNGSISAVDQETMKVSVSEEGEYKIVYYARDAYDNESYQMINLSVTK